MTVTGHRQQQGLNNLPRIHTNAGGILFICLSQLVPCRQAGIAPHFIPVERICIVFIIGFATWIRRIIGMSM